MNPRRTLPNLSQMAGNLDARDTSPDPARRFLFRPIAYIKWCIACRKLERHRLANLPAGQAYLKRRNAAILGLLRRPVA